MVINNLNERNRDRIIMKHVIVGLEHSRIFRQTFNLVVTQNNSHTNGVELMDPRFGLFTIIFRNRVFILTRVNYYKIHYDMINV